MTRNSAATSRRPSVKSYILCLGYVAARPAIAGDIKRLKMVHQVRGCGIGPSRSLVPLVLLISQPEYFNTAALDSQLAWRQWHGLEMTRKMSGVQVQLLHRQQVDDGPVATATGARKRASG